MNSRKLYLVLIIIFSSIIIGSLIYFYDYLGGNEEVVIYDLGKKERTIIGKQFAGTQTSPVIEEYFTDARRLVAEGTLQGELTMVNYKNDTLENNELSFFIGISIETNMAEIPPDYEVKQFTSDKVYAVFLSMHPLVRPSPSSTEEMLSEKAKNDSLILTNYFIEIHYPDNSLSVEGWTR